MNEIVPVGVRDPTTGAAACSGCGDCCRVLALDHTKARFKQLPIDPQNQHWIQYRLRRITKAQAFARNPNLARYHTKNPRVYYRCTWFDEETNLCTHHNERPPICRGFPWYDRAPEPTLKYLERCSYWWDVPQSAWPAYVHPDTEVIPLLPSPRPATAEPAFAVADSGHHAEPERAWTRRQVFAVGFSVILLVLALLLLWYSSRR